MHKSGDSREIYRGRLHDISLGGAGIYSAHEIYTEQLLVMLIEIPLPDSYGKNRKVIAGVQCSLHKPVFSEMRQQLRTGVQFRRFHGIDKHLLAEALFTRNQVVAGRNQEAGSQMQGINRCRHC
jgi:c-di-GMP-binding flagellar brake protein YcgR